jgi:hypothetical protein
MRMGIYCRGGAGGKPDTRSSFPSTKKDLVEANQSPSRCEAGEQSRPARNPLVLCRMNRKRRGGGAVARLRALNGASLGAKALAGQQA